MIGRTNARRGARRIFAVLQNRRLNQHIAYTIIDEVSSSSRGLYLDSFLIDDVLLFSGLHCTLSRVKYERGDVIVLSTYMDYLIRLKLCNE
jgi:hypothetical protein